MTRIKNFLFISLLSGLLAQPAGADEIGAASGKKLRVLVVTGGHDYDQAGFRRLWDADAGIAYRHEEHPQALATLTTSAAKDFDGVVLYDMVQPISAEQKKKYMALIQGGTGLVALHHSLASFQDWPEYEQMIGGKFFLAKHLEDGAEKPPSGYQHDVDIPVEIAAPDHFITRGLKDFTIHDETYSRFRVHPAAYPLLKTKHSLSGPVIGWTQTYGRARVVYLQLGHDDGAYSNPNYRQLVSRAIRWAARATPEDAAMAPLFNGKDLSGWKAEGQARFSVENGLLIGRQGPGGEAGDLFTEAEYGDFECEVTWSMRWPGNSGVWFRYQSPEKAYQADILEWKNPVCWSGSVYCPGKMFISMNTDPSIMRREGWNVFTIRARRDSIQVFLNGRQVSDVKEGTTPRGRLGFQVHPGKEFEGMEIRIADVRVKKLE